MDGHMRPAGGAGMPEGADRDTVPVAPDTASSPEEAGRRGILEKPEKTVSAVSYTHLDVYKRQAPSTGSVTGM